MTNFADWKDVKITWLANLLDLLLQVHDTVHIQTTGEGVTRDDPIFRCGTWSFERMLTDEITSGPTSVLSSLSISLLSFNHVRISAMHASIRWNVLVVLSSDNGLNDMYTCVSSAYKCSSTLCRRAISPRGAVYEVNKRGPNTDSWF